MTKEQYYSLKRGDLVRWRDTGNKCLVMHFDTTDYPKIGTNPRQEPNEDQSLCVIFLNDNYRLIGSRREFEYIKRKKSE